LAGWRTGAVRFSWFKTTLFIDGVDRGSLYQQMAHENKTNRNRTVSDIAITALGSIRLFFVSFVLRPLAPG
jgi:hypothetical protein